MLKKIANFMFAGLFLAACSGNIPEHIEAPALGNQLRPIPNKIEVPAAYQKAIKKGTRTQRGVPGANYWINSATYDISVKLIPDEKKVEGVQHVVYTNNSPDTLRMLGVNLLLNLHKEGAVRNEASEVTGGVKLSEVKVNDRVLTDTVRRGARYMVNGTFMAVILETPVYPGEAVPLDFAWSFKVPKEGASGRMGWSRDNLFYLGYFYPQMAVYDDVIGWHSDQFLGNAEFYADFADYNVTIEAPGNWLVLGTGELTNGKEVLTDETYNRMIAGHQSDSVVHVVNKDNFANATKGNQSNWLKWNFKSKNVRDVAYSLTTESNWDAARANVGDLDGDGKDDFSSINAIWRDSAPLWKDAWKFSKHSIEFLSRFTGIKYPYPHMTSVEGAGIIGGGMEFPMISIMGDYNRGDAQGLYGLIAHELAHEWSPMMVNNNERRYAWMDEGATSFNSNNASEDYWKNGREGNGDYRGYIFAARLGIEGEIMRWSDYHYNGFAYNTASYSKPSSLLRTLRGLLGDEIFEKAYQSYFQRWQYKHPYPWDLFQTFEDVSGQNLNWFWYSWYYQTWTLDQAVKSVLATDKGTIITIEDKGDAIMPVLLTIQFDDGTTEDRKISESVWLKGFRETEVTVPAGKTVTKVSIDPKNLFPDINPQNNTWEKE